MTAIVAELARAEVVAGASWRALRIDSLDLLDLIVRCEEETGVALPDAVVAGLRGPDDLIRYLDTAPTS